MTFLCSQVQCSQRGLCIREINLRAAVEFAFQRFYISGARGFKEALIRSLNGRGFRFFLFCPIIIGENSVGIFVLWSVEGLKQ